MKKLLLLLNILIITFSKPLFAMSPISIQPRTPSPGGQLTFEQTLAELPKLTEWIDNCNRLPLLQNILKNFIPKQLKKHTFQSIFQDKSPNETIVPITVFTTLMDHLISDFNETKNTNNWLTPLNEQNQAYIQKDTASLLNSIFFHADFHGDVKSLAKFLQDLKNQDIINNDWRVTEGNKIVFLGDYIDRGFYGLEVLYTLMILKLYNPQSVYILRGNHEEQKMYKKYNLGEIAKKVNNQHINPVLFFNSLNTFFDTLPSALYIKMPNNRFLLFTHGAHNHTDKKLKDFLNAPTKTYNAFPLSNYTEDSKLFNAYSWSDYDPKNTNKTNTIPNDRGSGYLYKKIPTTKWMNKYSVDTIIHGHSHYRTQLWGTDYQEQTHNPKGRVYGLPIAPDTTYGQDFNLNYDTYGSITIKNNTENNATEIKLEKNRIIPKDYQ